MRPVTRSPAANGPSSAARNQVPNSWESVMARQTRERCARRTIFFSVRWVVDIGTLRVAYYRRPAGNATLWLPINPSRTGRGYAPPRLPAFERLAPVDALCRPFALEPALAGRATAATTAIAFLLRRLPRLARQRLDRRQPPLRQRRLA